MIYLDNAATTKIDPEVLDAMMPYLKEEYGNAGTLYSLGRKAADAVDKAREQVANLIGAKSDEIFFTSGGSEANNMVFHSYAESSIFPPAVSAVEHESVDRASLSFCLSSTKHAKLPCYYIGVAKNCMVSTQEVENTFEKATENGDRIGLVSVIYINNETGAENPVVEIGKLCKKRGILFHTDCVQAAGCREIDVNRIACNYLSLSSHKIHGPKGVGALYAKGGRLNISPLIYGGEMQEFGRRGGTENVAGIVGFGKACELITKQQLPIDLFRVDALRVELYKGIEQKLAECGLQGVMHVNGDDGFVSGDPWSKGKILNVRFDGVDAETLLLMLDSRGVCATAGSACRSRAVEPSHVLLAMGLSLEEAASSIRFSLSRMNTRQEIREAAEIIADCVCSLKEAQ